MTPTPQISQDKAVEVALGLFSKLYYFVPPIEPFSVKVLPNKIREDGPSAIEIKEPLDAILWLLETLATEQMASNETCCFQPDLYNLIQRLTGWDRSKFTDELNKLLDTGLIDSKRRKDGDRRTNRLTLTPKGRKILNEIKTQRVAVITFLFQGQTPDQIEMMVLALGRMSEEMWKKMRSYKPGKRRSNKTAPRQAAQRKRR